jgi:hypothetical protein
VQRVPSETLKAPQKAPRQPRDDSRCAYIVGGIDSAPDFCGAVCQPDSPYCPKHHARCHLPEGSAAERQRLREIEALAAAVGGKRGRAARRPPLRLLRRLDRVVRDVSCLKCSRIVLKEEAADGD